MGDSQGIGAGPVGLTAAAAGFSAGVDGAEPGMGFPAGAFVSPLGGGVGDLVSSGIPTVVQASRAAEGLEER